jgi:hypothetical protein
VEPVQRGGFPSPERAPPGRAVQVGGGLGQQLVARVAEALAGPPIGVQDAAVPVEDEDGVGRLFDQAAIPFLAGLQRLFGPLGTGQVADESGEDRRVGGPDPGDGDFGWELGPVRTPGG